jgi:hypothetical protein
MPGPDTPSAVIQQVVPISITLQGNGTASSFSFKLSDLPAVNSAGKGILINTRAMPISAEGSIAELPNAQVTCNIGAGTGLITCTFQPPLPAEGPSTLNLKLYFESAAII